MTTPPRIKIQIPIWKKILGGIKRFHNRYWGRLYAVVAFIFVGFLTLPEIDDSINTVKKWSTRTNVIETANSHNPSVILSNRKGIEDHMELYPFGFSIWIQSNDRVIESYDFLPPNPKWEINIDWGSFKIDKLDSDNYKVAFNTGWVKRKAHLIPLVNNNFISLTVSAPPNRIVQIFGDNIFGGLQEDYPSIYFCVLANLQSSQIYSIGLTSKSELKSQGLSVSPLPAAP